MADRTYATLVGIVQQFGEDPVMRERTVAGQSVREFTVKSATSDKLVRVTLWPEWDDVVVEAGTGIIAEGTLAVNESGTKTYYNLNPKTLAISTPVGKKARKVVNSESF